MIALGLSVPGPWTRPALAPHAIQWLVIAFVLTQTSLTLVFGRLGDLFGHRRIFAIGLATCAVAHLAVGLAPDDPSLVALRVLQGLGGVLIAAFDGPAVFIFRPPLALLVWLALPWVLPALVLVPAPLLLAGLAVLACVGVERWPWARGAGR